MTRLAIDNSGLKIVIGIVIAINIWYLLSSTYIVYISPTFDEVVHDDFFEDAGELPDDFDDPDPDMATEDASISSWWWGSDPLDALARLADYLMKPFELIYNMLKWIYSGMVWLYDLAVAVGSGISQMSGMVGTIIIIAPIFVGLAIVVVSIIIRWFDLPL